MSEQPIRNRIKGQRLVRASDLVPHEWNFRTHRMAGLTDAEAMTLSSRTSNTAWPTYSLASLIAWERR